MSNCISITPLLLSDTFLTWFQRTNQAISTLNTFQIRGLSASSDFEGIKLTDNGSCFYQIELVHGPFVGFVTDGDSGIYGTGDATNPYNLTLKFNGNEPTLGDEDLTGDDYFIVSDTSDSSSVKKVSAGAILNLIPEENRYFYGPTAPSEPDLLLGDKWFNTTVGSEFTYLYTDTDEDTFVWVDIDHLGRGETGFVRLVGDTMTGTLTGTNASFSGITATNGFIGTLTGTNASFSGITAENASFTSFTAANGFIGTLTADRGFRQSEVSFIDNELITKKYVDDLKYEQAENMIINGDFSVWQRGDAFRVMHRIEHRNQTKKQIGLNYYNFNHHFNIQFPKFHVRRGDPETPETRVDFFRTLSFHTSDRWRAGWGGMTTDGGLTQQVILKEPWRTSDGSWSGITASGLTAWGNVEKGRGFYVFRGLATDEDMNYTKNSENFLRISTSPPCNSTPYPSTSQIRTFFDAATARIWSEHKIFSGASNFTFGEKGLTFWSFFKVFAPDSLTSDDSDYPEDLKTSISNGEKSYREISDPQYVGSFVDPFMDWKPTPTGTMPNDFWAELNTFIPHVRTRKLGFGTNDPERMKISFLCRGNVTGDYGVSLRNSYDIEGQQRSFVHKITIDEKDTWKKYEFSLTADTNSLWNDLDSFSQQNISRGRIVGYGRTDMYLSFCIASGTDYKTTELDSWLTGDKTSPTTQVNLLSATGNYMDIAEVKMFKESEESVLLEPNFSDVAKNIYECKMYYESNFDGKSVHRLKQAVDYAYVHRGIAGTIDFSQWQNFLTYTTNEIPPSSTSFSDKIYSKSMRAVQTYPGVFAYVGGTSFRGVRSYPVPVGESSQIQTRQNVFHTYSSSSESGVFPRSVSVAGGIFDNECSSALWVNTSGILTAQSWTWTAGAWGIGDDTSVTQLWPVYGVQSSNIGPDGDYGRNYLNQGYIDNNISSPSRTLRVLEETRDVSYDYTTYTPGQTGSFEIPGWKTLGYLTKEEWLYDIGLPYGYRGWGSVGSFFRAVNGLSRNTVEGAGGISLEFGQSTTQKHIIDDTYSSGVVSVDLDW